jgi:mono/diheme cytochrome c family protein
MLLFISTCQAEEQLTISIPGYEKSYSRKALLAHPDLVLIKQVHLPSYPNQSFDLQAIPLCSLLKINKDVGSILKIRGWDKYLSYFTLERLYPCDPKRESIAYIAIEEPEKPWPIAAKLKRSAGPFYLIWQGKPVAQTDWVFGPEMISITNRNPFSNLLPVNSSTQETKGLEQFASKCGVCHSINLVGNLEFGPDLNYPMNPTEYFSEKILRQFIRNSQSIRHMKYDKMLAFSEKLLSEEEMDDLISFLKLMKNHKIQNIQ